MKPARLNPVLPFWLLVAGIFVLYRYMLCPTVPAGDSGELITAAATLGIAHPPGYPLYILLGKLFSFIPLGSVAYRLNLMSAVCNAFTVGLVYLIGLRIILRAQGNRQPETGAPQAAGAGPAGHAVIPALLGALFLAFSLPFWHYALVAEAFALNSLLAAILIYLLLPEPGGKFPACLWSGLLGLACCNHQTIILLLPAFAYYIWRTWPETCRVKTLSLCCLCFCLGLLPYLYLPLAAQWHPWLSWGKADTLKGFLEIVTRKEYGSLMLSAEDPYRHGFWLQLPALGSCLYRYFSVWGLALAALGLAAAWKKCRALFWFLLLGFICSGPAFLMLANINAYYTTFEMVISRFYLLISIFVALFISLGGWALLAALQRLPAAVAPGTQAFIRALVPVIVMLTPLSILVSHYPAVNQRGNYLTADFAANVLRTLPPDSLLLTTGDTLLGGLSYLMAVEGLRPDVILIKEMIGFPWYVEYLARQYPGLKLPFGRGGKTAYNMSDLAAANLDRHEVFTAASFDPSLKRAFQQIPYGVLTQLLPRTQALNLTRYKARQTAIWSSYRIDYHRLAGLGNWDFEKIIAYSYTSSCHKTGLFWLQHQDYPEAITYWERALRIAPEYPTPYKMLGWAYLKSARTPEMVAKGLQCWRTYLGFNPEDPEVEEIKKIMQSKP